MSVLGEEQKLQVVQSGLLNFPLHHKGRENMQGTLKVPCMLKKAQFIRGNQGFGARAEPGAAKLPIFLSKDFHI